MAPKAYLVILWLLCTCNVVTPSIFNNNKLNKYDNVSLYYCLNFNLQVGHTILHRENYIDLEDDAPPLLPLHCQMPVLEALMICVQMGWMAILVCCLNVKYLTVTFGEHCTVQLFVGPQNRS